MADHSTLLFTILLALAIFIDAALVFAWRKRRRTRLQEGAVQVLGTPSPVLTALKYLFWERWKLRIVYTKLAAWRSRICQQPWIQRLLPARTVWSSLAELVTICAWAVFVARNALDFTPNMVLNGGEFPNLVQTHYIWSLLPRCGLCFLWNGSINGGAPALAELSGAVLHPLVFLPVLAWGVINGSKVTLAASLALAGIAQWRLARTLGLGAWARLWSALIIVAGGHLAGKMQNGNLSLVVGLASAALALSYGVDLLFNRNRSALPGLAVALALTALSGEGYIQIGFVLSMLPMLGLFCLGRGPETKPIWKDYLLSLGLAALLAGVFLAPLLHILPLMRKDTDASLGNYPPLTTIPLNLVVDDLKFYHTEQLGQDPYPYSHILYIGWIPVLLALLALALAPRRLSRVRWIFFTGIGLVFLITTAELARAISQVIPAVTQLRHLTVASGLAVPLIVGLAAVSLDELLRLAGERARIWKIPAPAAVLPAAAVIAVLSIPTCYRFSQEFFGVHPTSWLAAEVEGMRTSSAQWVRPPLGNYDWTLLALERGMKITGTWRPWFWAHRQDPLPYLEAVPKKDQTDSHVFLRRSSLFGYAVYPAAEYAFITPADEPDKMIPCQAVSQGGWVDIVCQNTTAGTLTVREHPWSGWYAWIDGQPAVFREGDWMHLDASSGAHVFRLRYLPWDAALGLMITAVGIWLCVLVHARVRRILSETTNQ